MVAQLMAKVFEVVFVEASFEKRPAIDTRRSVSLEIDQITRLIAVAPVEKMVKTDLEQGRKRRVR